ncbi:hypothetical protein SALBM217S_06382 [Streptomyces griseoloalbus]
MAGERCPRNGWCSPSQDGAPTLAADGSTPGTPHGTRTTPFPYGDERFGIPQRDDLEFELLVKELT